MTLPDADPPPAAADAARATWSAALGGRPVVLVADVERARALLARAIGLEDGEPVALPANATRPLVEAVKRVGARPRFVGLGPDLAPRADPGRLAGVRVAWLEPPGGLTVRSELPPDVRVLLDHADSLPASWPAGGPEPAATLYGLHLTAEPERAGALLQFGDSSLCAAVSAILGPDDGPDPTRALAQCRRLLGDTDGRGLAARQQANLDEARRGLREAAGLPLLPSIAPTALAGHVAVRIPEEADPSTFYAYVRGENTPIRWLPELRPVHHAALRDPDAEAAATVAHLARWLLLPVGPDDGEAELAQAVLGVVKAGEYLGVRWRTDPARAAEYAALLDSWYGPDHDAYRPAFPAGSRR